MIRHWLSDWWDAHVFEFFATPALAVLGFLISAFVLWLSHRRPKPPCSHTPDFCCHRCIQRAMFLNKAKNVAWLSLLIVVAIGSMVLLSVYIG